MDVLCTVVRWRQNEAEMFPKAPTNGSQRAKRGPDIINIIMDNNTITVSIIIIIIIIIISSLRVLHWDNPTLILGISRI